MVRGRTKGALSCPVHRKQLMTKCECLKAYGHGVTDKFVCPNCDAIVPWINNWTDKSRKPFYHASAACVAKSSSLVEAKV